MKGEEKAKEGWSEASISGGSHLKRMVEMYHELGFEVYLEEVDPKECEGCTVCYESGSEIMYRVYTRPKNGEK
jgi:hypothetical protein